MRKKYAYTYNNLSITKNMLRTSEYRAVGILSTAFEKFDAQAFSVSFLPFRITKANAFIITFVYCENKYVMIRQGADNPMSRVVFRPCIRMYIDTMKK